MSIHRSKHFEQVREQVYADYGPYSPTGEEETARRWRKTTGGRWRNRVGLPRLTAAEALSVADDLLRSINLAVFKNEPEIADRLRAARADVYDLTVDVVRENWRRFEEPTP